MIKNKPFKQYFIYVTHCQLNLVWFELGQSEEQTRFENRQPRLGLKCCQTNLDSLEFSSYARVEADLVEVQFEFHTLFEIGSAV